MAAHPKPLVGIIMGSQSDWETLQHTAAHLDELDVPYELQIISAHRTPDLLFEYASTAAERGLEVIIAAAGGAAHLAGVTAAKTVLPVLGVPMESKSLHGMDSLLSMVQMPGGVPVGTLAIGKPGAINAALFATAIIINRAHRSDISPRFSFANWLLSWINIPTMASFEAQRRTFGGLALVAAAVLTSCKVKVETPVPPEFAAGISYTNYRVRS